MPLAPDPSLNLPNANISRHLGLMARQQPDRAALKIPRGRTGGGEIDYLTLSFAELDAEANLWAARLTGAGVVRGDRTLVMVRQGLPLIAAAFALFRIGAVPVIIDPGMGRKSFLACVARSQPRALVGIPLAQIFSWVFRTAFRSVKVRVGASGSLTARLPASRDPVPAEAHNAADDVAAILFTSGSTGAPKGVVYEHGMFEAQVRLIRETYGIQPGEIDLPMLPIFALFNPALGMTTIVPEMDPRRPAEIDPARIVQAIQQEKVTNSFGSPTLWNKIGEHCRTNGITLPTLRRVLCAGAPVPAALWRRAPEFLPAGQLHSPYGATEALPVATISAAEVQPGELRGACVGRPLPGIEVRVIPITDEPLADLGAAGSCAPGEIGELIVRGPVVTKSYDALPDATRRAKIPGSTPGDVWHRMGDCGWIDESGRIWFCGRKAERVVTAQGTLHIEPCEQVFRSHPRAARCALIGVDVRGRRQGAIVAETAVRDSAEARALTRELRALALQHPSTAEIKVFYFHPQFPVDVRHNAKIHRLALARWALTSKGYESDPKR
jgi:acyl-CoA synthetase (AMP-forming)/AMP-acid ligase II